MGNVGPCGRRQASFKTTKSANTGHISDRNVSNKARTKSVFLDMGLIEPDITPILLLKAGDVERNPGPPINSPEDEVCKTVGENEVCGKCKNKLKSTAKRIRCTVCQEDFHKTTCTEELRSVIDKVDREGSEWTCKICRQIQSTSATQMQPCADTTV